MKNNEDAGGDSGGPWYYGNTVYGVHVYGVHVYGVHVYGVHVYGVHKGSKWIWFKRRDIFSQLTNVGSALNGVTVELCKPTYRACGWDCGVISIGCGKTIYCECCDPAKSGGQNNSQDDPPCPL